MQLDQIQHEITEWSNATFAGQTYKGRNNKLIDEMGELENLLLAPGVAPETIRDSARAEIVDECADVLFVLVQIASQYEFSLDEAVMAKFERNRNREWGTMQPGGVFQHTKDA